MQGATHPTKVDWWLAAIVLGAIAALFVAGIHAFANDTLAGVVVTGSGVLMLLIIGGFAWPMRYTLTHDRLRVRTGMMQTEIPYHDIEAVFMTRDPRASAGWSLDRLHIDFVKHGKKRVILISPVDRLRFMRDLAARADGLAMRGDRLVRDG